MIRDYATAHTQTAFSLFWNLRDLANIITPKKMSNVSLSSVQRKFYRLRRMCVLRSTPRARVHGASREMPPVRRPLPFSLALTRVCERQRAGTGRRTTKPQTV